MPSGSEGTSANGLDAGMGRGLEFLRRSQLQSGEFKVCVSPDVNLQYDCVFDSSPFPAALIAYWLGFDDKATMDVLRKALRFLLNLRARYR
ncbi:MAG TPA: hypothetical protein VGJ55_04135 [Pyrinomonadaceae bacterium]|jgi:hypothetical protein